MKILIATDGSEFSRTAIEHGCKIANLRDQAEIKVISVFEPNQPIGTEPFAISAEYYAELNKLAEERASGWARDGVDLINSIRMDNGAEVSSVVQQGTPARSIVETAEAWGADLIVVGSHGRGFWGRLTLGSVSEAVLHHAPCSVLIVKEPTKRSRPDRDSE